MCIRDSLCPAAPEVNRRFLYTAWASSQAAASQDCPTPTSGGHLGQYVLQGQPYCTAHEK
eukprot:14611736-Alexandrium_andersonii.AAC.1